MKKILALVVTTTLVIATGTALASDRFFDVPDGHTHHANITWAHDQGIVRGHIDGSFRPDTSITRGEAATLFARYEDTVDERIAGAWSGPVYTLTPDFEAESCQVIAIDHNGVGSGAASVEYSVDGSQPVEVGEPIPAEGSLAFEVNAEGMVSVLVDGIAQAHAHTAEGCALD